MHALTILQGLALAVSAVSAQGRVYNRRQNGPVDPGTASDCTLFDDAVDATYTCKYFEDLWALPHKDFVDWNPSVKQDCSGIKTGNSYCVEVNYGLPRTTTTTSAAPTTTTGALPSPTQEGLIKTCTRFYLAQSGDTCDKIVNAHGTFSFEDFLAWNPAVGKDCASLWAKTYYCVGISGTPAKPTSTTAPTGTPKPSPTQDGLINSCTTFYKAASGDTCDKIVGAYGTFSFDEFLKWNPAVGNSCTSLFVNYYYCIGIPGTPTTKPPTTGPSPTQAGLIKTCNKFYQAKSGDTCQFVVTKYPEIKLNDFYKWNPAVKTDCTGLLLGYYYCVGVPVAFRLKTKYRIDCTGTVHDDVIMATDSNGICVNTDCQVGSIETAAEGLCPDGQVQISYWEKPGCTGQWYGYGYTSRGECRGLWTDGYKFKALHFRCARQQDDCVSKKTCTYDPEPAKRVC